MIGDTLANDCECRAGCTNRVEASQNLVKRTVDRDALEMGELSAPETKVRVHEHVGLKSAPEAALAPAGTARQR